MTDEHQLTEAQRLGRTAFVLETASIEKDARISELTGDEIDSIVHAVITASRLASYDSNAFRKDNGDKERENPVEAPTRIHFLQTRITELEAQIVELTDTRIQAEKRNNALAEELRALGDPRRLDEIPIGLFMANGELCLKTEYREPNGAVSAFIVSSGEFFCGPSPQTVASQNADTVTPVSLDFVLAALEGDE